jgi:hypothetical protein
MVISRQPNLFTAKGAKGAKKEMIFCFSLAVFASFAVELLG